MSTNTPNGKNGKRGPNISNQRLSDVYMKHLLKEKLTGGEQGTLQYILRYKAQNPSWCIDANNDAMAKLILETEKAHLQILSARRNFS